MANENGATAHNGLVGGSSPPGPTTHSRANQDFPRFVELPRLGGVCCERSVSAKGQLNLGGHFAAFVSGLETRLPGNGDRREQRPVRLWSLLRHEA
jgi:hypothetical protein